MKILLTASEVAPLAKTGGLADVAGSLPKALRALGHDIRIMLPAYQSILVKDKGFTSTGKMVEVLLGDKVYTAEVLEGKLGQVPVYLIKSDTFYNRTGIYGHPGGKEYEDNACRFGFFCFSVLEALKTLSFSPEIIHCNDWHTALIPGLLRSKYVNDPFYRSTKILYTIHNLEYQGIFSLADLDNLGIDPELYSNGGYQHNGKANFMAGGITFADAINTVSPNYAREIQTIEYGGDLHDLFYKRQKQLIGILNGIDYQEWNPSTDAYIFRPYSLDTLELKKENKLALQKEMGLDEDPDVLILGLISRLVEQKGVDLLEQALTFFLKKYNLQVIVLGTGEKKYEDLILGLAQKYSQKVRVELNYNEPLAHKIYAGVDIILMPSRYEPCGLCQIIAFRYGVVPVVRATGGLVDTVKDYLSCRDKGNGFLFNEYTSEALLQAIHDAIKIYREQPEVWQEIMSRGMQQDLSWKKSALKYTELYNNMHVSAAVAQ